MEVDEEESDDQHDDDVDAAAAATANHSIETEKIESEDSDIEVCFEMNLIGEMLITRFVPAFRSCALMLRLSVTMLSLLMKPRMRRRSPRL